MSKVYSAENADMLVKGRWNVKGPQDCVFEISVQTLASPMPQYYPVTTEFYNEMTRIAMGRVDDPKTEDFTKYYGEAILELVK